METSIVKWGNSLSVRIPKSFAYTLDLSENARVDMVIEDGNIVLKPIRKDLRKRIEDRFAEFEQANGLIEGELDWGRPEGEEVW